MGNWFIKSTLYIYEFLCLKQNFQKKVVTGKTPFFEIGPFCTPHSIFPNIGFWHDSFVWKCCVFNFSTFNSKAVLQFFEKVFVFQKKNGLKVKVLKICKISSDCHIKTCLSLRLRAILIISAAVFYKKLCSFSWL